MRNKILVGAIGVVLCAGSVLADTRLEFKTTEGTGDLKGLTIAQGKIRTDADNNTSVILDPGAGVMTVLDHGKKTFTKITKADMEALVKQLEDTMAQVPPEMRQMMAARMGGAGAAVSMAPTGQSSTVGGKACKVYQMTATGRVVSESCLAEVSAIEISAADRATLQAAAAWSKDLTDALAKTPLGRIGDSIPFRGGLVPLRSTTIAANGTRNTSEFSGVSTAAVTADTFAIPADYKEQKMGMGRGRGGF